MFIVMVLRIGPLVIVNEEKPGIGIGEVIKSDICSGVQKLLDESFYCSVDITSFATRLGLKKLGKEFFFFFFF